MGPEGEARRATPEEVREALQEASAVFVGDPGVAAKAKAAARMHGLSRVRKALAWAKAREARSFGYVLTLLRDWRESGVVVDPPVETEDDRKAREHREKADRDEAAVERLLRERGLIR